MSRTKKENLLTRWSRLKRESVTGSSEGPGAALAVNHEATVVSRPQEAGEAGQKPEDQSPLQLPPLEELGPDSDFQAFMDPRVDDKLRRAALKTLFRDPSFNVTDGLDVYAEDYTKLEKLTPAMVAALRYAQRHLFGKPDQPESAGTTDVADNEGDASESGARAGDASESGESGSIETDIAPTLSTETVAGNDDDEAMDMSRAAGTDRPTRGQSAEPQTDSVGKRTGTGKS